MSANPVGLHPGENTSQASAHPAAAAGATDRDWLERKFTRLRDEWKSQRGPESSTTRLAMHPAYQKIIGMGPAVVPLLLRELESDLDSWFWALRAITEEDPVPEDARGDGEAMAQAWLKWGKERGIPW
jgi:hypothetical protein